MSGTLKNIIDKSSNGLDLLSLTKWLLIILFLFTDSSIYAQKGRIRFENISLQEGLPQSAVYCILQDKNGFMWFGTQDGLCRYDGYQFKIYRNDFKKPTTISDNYILSILEDRAGFLWVGTLGGGLDKFDPNNDTFTRYEHQPDNHQSISSNEVKCIYQDHWGNLWIGTNGGGLNEFDPQKGSF